MVQAQANRLYAEGKQSLSQTRMGEKFSQHREEEAADDLTRAATQSPPSNSF